MGPFLDMIGSAACSTAIGCFNAAHRLLWHSLFRHCCLTILGYVGLTFYRCVTIVLD